MLNHRKIQDSVAIEHSDPDNVLSSLLSVQLNTTELCNRTCVFCPRVDPEIYPNRNIHMTVETAEKIAVDLRNINFVGRISLSGFGEPLLNKNIIEILTVIRKHLPTNIIDTNTNGDKLDNHIIKKLYNNGLSFIYVNLYDGPEQLEHFKKMFYDIDKSKYIFREHYSEKNTYNLILNNRAGTLYKIEKSINDKCYFPFSKAMIDYNGDLLLCPQDWGRQFIVGSLLTNSIGELWLSDKMREIRYKLHEGDRSSSPCNQCDCQGTLTGEYGYNVLMKHYLTDKS